MEVLLLAGAEMLIDGPIGVGEGVDLDATAPFGSEYLAFVSRPLRIGVLSTAAELRQKLARCPVPDA